MSAWFAPRRTTSDARNGVGHDGGLGAALTPDAKRARHQPVTR